jgi:hypothetical protein
MAYVPSYVDDEEEKKKAAQPTTAVASAAPATTQVGTGGGAGPLQSKGFVGIGQYLDANKEQAQGMADKITAPIGERVSEAQAGQEQYAQDWKDDYQGRVDDWRKAGRKEQADLNTGFQDQVNQAYYDWQRTPENVAPTTKLGLSKYNTAKEAREAAYQDMVRNAPKANLELAPTPGAYTPDTSAAQAIEGDLSALETLPGRQAMLQKQASGVYTPGESLLDATLLGTTDIGQAGNKYEGILNALRNPTAPAVSKAGGIGPPVSRYELEQNARKEYEKRMKGEMI